MNTKSDEIEKLVTQIRNKLQESNDYHVDHEWGIGRKFGEHGLIDEIFYDGRETIVIKINHCEEGKLNSFPNDQNYIKNEQAREIIEKMIQMKNRKASVR
jgi:hypothetical protein